MITFTTHGSWEKTEASLKKMSKLDVKDILESFAQSGVAALSSATPADSGLAASSWDYEVSGSGKSWMITWTNSNVENGFPVAIMLQYGHGTGTGGWVQGQDYINPAIRPVFDQIADSVWKVVTSA